MPFTQTELTRIFGAFTYRNDPRRKGAIIIDHAWVKANVVSITTPHGTFSCHRKIAYQAAAFLRQACAERFITDIGGIWVPRHILWDSKRPLSGHAYGCDIDLNVDDGKDGPGRRINHGDNSYQPARLLELAARWGFEWGGNWRRGKDGMHFSCIRLIKQSTGSNGQNLARPASKPPELRLGHRGVAVKTLQRRLCAKGYALAIDGIFGPHTAGALIAWQEKNGFKASGRADPQTWKSLD